MTGTASNIVYSKTIRLSLPLRSLQSWDFPGLPLQGVWVRSLVRELRSHMPRGQKKQNIKQKQYCNKFNKEFKNGPHQKNL